MSVTPRVLLTLFLVFGSADAALSQTRWSSEYLPADTADEMSVCVAGIQYADAFFMVRLADQNIDFIFSNNDLAIPPGQELGTVVFKFAQSNYRLRASSVLISDSTDGWPVNWITLFTEVDATIDIVTAMKYGNRFDVVFPDGSSYTVDLDGSSRAIDDALMCWEERHTGFAGRNPFGVGSGQRNPFQLN